MSTSFASNSNLRGAQRGAALTTATSSFAGVVRVDGSSMLVDANGTISVDFTSTNSSIAYLSSVSTSSIAYLSSVSTSSIAYLSSVSTSSIAYLSSVASTKATTSTYGVVKADGTSIAISGGLINIATSSNGFGIRTISTSNPSGGSTGDIWYKI
jgi:hypothetical protein